MYFKIGITKVAYIDVQQDDAESAPNSITLPPEADLESKDACTLDLESFKSEQTEKIEDVDFLIEEHSEGNIDNANIGAIANAVKATLANQPGILLILVLE